MNRIYKTLLMGLAVVSLLGFGKISTTKADAAPGSLIKMNGLSSVYYLGQDGKRYVFPSQNVYFSWYKDFSGVVTISQSELESYPLGANITMRPGTRLVKITTNPKVYAVEPGGSLRAIPDEATAEALYGPAWNKRIDDIADAFFTNYKMGDALASSEVPAGSLVKNEDSAAVYYYDGTNYRSIADEAAFNANRFSFDHVLTIDNKITAGGSSITGNEFANPDASATGQGTQPGQGTGLTVALSANTPASASVPQNGIRVPFTKVNLTASADGAIVINSLVVKRTGLSDYDQINRVWAEHNGKIVASKKSMNSNDESILVFSPALSIPAGQTVSLDLVASLNTQKGGNIGLSVLNASAINVGSASVTGSFPINGNLMSLVEYDVAKLLLDGENIASQNIKVGDINVDLGHFNLSLISPAKDISIDSIMLKNNGVEDLATTATNFYLENAGEKITSDYSINGRFITFDFNNGFELLRDDSSKTIYLKGDIIAKENIGPNSYEFELNKSTDLIANEKSTGFGVNTYSAYTNPTTNTKANAKQISVREIEAGVVSIAVKADNPSNTTIIKGSDHTVLLANIRVDEQINTDGLAIWYYDLNADQFENARIFLNGVLLDSFSPVKPSTTSTDNVTKYNVDSSLTLNKGNNEVKVMVKAKSNATTSSKFYVEIKGDDVLAGMHPEYVVSGNPVQPVDISGNAKGGEFTVEGANLTTVRNDGYPTDKVIVRGSNNVSLGKFNVKASSDTIKITSINLSANNQDNTSASSTEAQYISDMKLFVDGNKVAGPVNFSSSGSVFSSLNISIAKDQVKSLEVRGSFDSNAKENSLFRTTMTIYAQDSRGGSITTGNTATTTRFKIVKEGSLIVEKGGDSPEDGILVTRSDDQEVAQFKFTALNDSANLTEISIVNWDGSAATSSADARIASFKLYDGSTLIDQFVPIDGKGKFTVNNKVNIPANGNKTLSVKVSLNDINNDVDATNGKLQVKLTEVKFKSSAGTEVTETLTNKVASAFHIRKTVPTITKENLANKLRLSGSQAIAKFTVTADANGDVEVEKFTLDIDTNTTIATTTDGLKVNGSNRAAEQDDTTSGKLTVKLNTPETITAGSTKTFEVLVGVTVKTGASDPGLDASYVNARLVEDITYSSSNTDTSSLFGSFIWSDGAHITTKTWAGSNKLTDLSDTEWELSK